MTSKYSDRRWLAALRRVFPWFLRERHYASLQSKPAAQKLEPIKKVVADAGRDFSAPAD